MDLQKVTLPTAYMLETLRSMGKSNEEILEKVKDGDVSSWNELDSHFDFTQLIELAKDNGSAFESIVRDGYQVKFVTVRGVENLLRLKFDKVVDRDFTSTEKGITGLELTSEQLSTFSKLLSSNWHIEKTDNQKIKIELA
ncbi:hypothetical protein [Fredinandcohnia sp. 179-A 10B2 NHS]|uniref:hypothetical protein n=1 Tax=Fredinandcohnia sp. 179-A 10B2 NHS TaxID=3235176 RepID=UPI00399FBA8A